MSHHLHAVYAERERRERQECLLLLLREVETRSVVNQDNPDVLCAIDRQLISRARKAMGLGGGREA